MRDDSRATTVAVSQVLARWSARPRRRRHVVRGSCAGSSQGFACCRRAVQLPVACDLLPKDSILFFYIDRGWTDALVQGGSSSGRSPRPPPQLEAVYPIAGLRRHAEPRIAAHPAKAISPAPAARSPASPSARAVSVGPGARAAIPARVIEDDALTTGPRRIRIDKLLRSAVAAVGATRADRRRSRGRTHR